MLERNSDLAFDAANAASRRGDQLAFGLLHGGDVASNAGNAENVAGGIDDRKDIYPR